MDYAKLLKSGVKHITSLKRKEVDQSQKKKKDFQRFNIKLGYCIDNSKNSNKIKNLEQKLRSQREILFNMINSKGKINFILDSNTNIELVSEDWEKLSSKQPTLSFLQYFKDLTHPDDYKHLKSKLNNLIQKKSKKIYLEFRIKNYNKNWKKQQLEMNAINDSKGNIIYYFGSFFPFPNI